MAAGPRRDANACYRHRWVRKVKRGSRGSGPSPVGLAAARSDDYCLYCHKSRAEVEGIPA